MTFPLTDTNWFDNEFFTEAELRCRGTGQLRLHPGFLEALVRLRRDHDRPMVITSGCRARTYNSRVGGAADSLHICDLPQAGCMAVDVRATPLEAPRLARLALDRGWSVGVPRRGFIHIDARFLIKRPQVLFGY